MHVPLMLIALVGLMDPPAAVAPEERVTFADLAPTSQSYLKRHALTTFKMPDGSVWDGYYYFELRKLLGAHLSLEPIKKSVPAGPIMRENRTIGRRWALSDAEVVQAWGLKVSSGQSGVKYPSLMGGYSRSHDAARTEAWPVLWHSPDLGRPPAFFDDGTFLGTTGEQRGEYINILREFEDKTVEIQGWVPIFVPIDSPYGADTFRGRALLDKGIRPKDGKLSGKFFVHYPPVGDDTEAQLFVTRVDDHRITAEQLLELVQDGRFTLYEFDYTRTTDGRYIWRREPFKMQVRQQSPATPIAPTEKESAAPKEALPAPGMDRVLLKDGRLFVGKVIAQDDKAVKIKTLIGTMEAELSFARADVQNVHIEPEGGQGPKSDE